MASAGSPKGCLRPIIGDNRAACNMQLDESLTRLDKKVRNWRTFLFAEREGDKIANVDWIPSCGNYDSLNSHDCAIRLAQ